MADEGTAQISKKAKGPPSYPMDVSVIDKYHNLPTESRTKLSFLEGSGRRKTVGISLGLLAEKRFLRDDVPDTSAQNVISKSSPYRLAVNKDRYEMPWRDKSKNVKSVYHKDKPVIGQLSTRTNDEEQLLSSVTLSLSLKDRRGWSPIPRAHFDTYPTAHPPHLVFKPKITISGRPQSKTPTQHQIIPIGQKRWPAVFLSFSPNSSATVAIFKFAEYLQSQDKYRLWQYINEDGTMTEVGEHKIPAVKEADVTAIFIDSNYFENSEAIAEARTTKRYNKRRVIVNMAKQPISNGWFDLIGENQPWVDYDYENEDNCWENIIYLIDNQITANRQKAPDKKPQETAVAKFFGDDLFCNQTYLSRPDVEETLRERVKEVARGTGPALLLVHGPGGSGKSSVVRHTLDGEFLRNCGILTRAYLHVYHLSKNAAFNREDEIDFYEELANLLSVQRSANENVHRAVQNYIRKAVGKVMLILDEICHRGILECAKTLSQNAVVVCISRHSYWEDVGKHGWIYPPAIEVGRMAPGTQRQLFSTCETKLVAAALNGVNIVDRLIELTNGLPLLAQAMCCGVLTSKSIEDARSYVKYLELNYTRLLVTQESADETKNPSAIWRLLLLGFEGKGAEFRRRCYGFLMFEKGAVIDLDDLTILWGCDDYDAEDFADQLVEMAFACKDPSNRRFSMHFHFYDALLEFATKQDENYSKFEDLVRLRGGLLLETVNETTNENMLHIAIARRREKLVRALTKAMTKHDVDGELFFRLTSQQNDAGELYMHLLMKASDWITSPGTPLEKNFAYEMASYLGEQLLTIDRFRGEELMAAVGDIQHNSVVGLVKHSIAYGAKSCQNVLHICAVNDYGELLDFLLDNGVDMNADDENGNTAFHLAAVKARPLISYRLLQRDAEIQPNARNKNKETALLLATKSGTDAMCRSLLEEAQQLQINVEIEVSDKDGNTPLLAAVQHNKVESAKLLLQLGAHVSTANKDGNRAIWLATMNNMELAFAVYEMGGRLTADEIAVLRLRAMLTRNQQMDEILASWQAENRLPSIETNENGFPAYQYVSKALFRMLKIPEPSTDDEHQQDNISTFLRLAYEGDLASLTRFTELREFDSSVKDAAMFIATYFGHETVATFICTRLKASPNFMNTDHVTSLITAASRGCTSVVAASAKAKADVDATDIATSTPALIWASAKGHFEIARILLDADANYDAFDDNGMTALMFASANGHVDIINILIAKRANVEARNRNGATALMIASAYGQEEATKALVTQGKAMVNNMCDKDGKTALMFAAENNHTDVARILLANKAQVNTVNKDEWNSLMFAAKNGVDGKMISLLIPFNADVNAKDRTGRTALMIACESGREAIVQALLDNDLVKVDVLAKTRDEDLSALMLAVKYGHDWIVRSLAKKVNVNTPNKFGITPFLLAVVCGQEIVTGTLIRRGADVTWKKGQHETALMIAAECGYEGIVTTLVRLEATDVNAVNMNGETALMIASAKGQAGVVEILLNCDAVVDVDMQQRDGYTALMLATVFCQTAVVKALLTSRRRADVTVRDNNGNTALSLAMADGSREIVELLIHNGAEAPSSPFYDVGNDDNDLDQDDVDVPLYELDFQD